MMQPDDDSKSHQISTDIASLDTETTNTLNNSNESCIDKLISKFSVLIIDYPFKVIGVFLLILAIIVMIDAFFFELSSIDDHAYYVLSDLNTNRMDALTLAREHIARSNVVYADVKTQGIDEFTLVLMYKTTKNENILSPQHIEWINYMNQQIVTKNNTLYYRLCLTDINEGHDTNFPDCNAMSRTDPFHQYFNSSQDITPNDIDIFIKDTLPTKADNITFLAHFGPDFIETNFTRLYRCFFRFGLPYPDIDAITSSFQNSYDKTSQQEQYYIDYIFPLYQNLQVDEDEKYSDVDTVIGGWLVRDLQFDTFAPSGIVYAVGSGISVLLVMSIHLNSIFLAVFGLIQICCAFPFAYFVYRLIIGIQYFDAMCLLIVFVILGIGADDCFVFVDAFIQSNHLIQSDSCKDSHELIIKRMAYAYKRASHAMLVTTLTTAFAFAATSLSPLIPISAFGIWATFCVICNYLLVITLYPCIVSLHYQYIQKYEKWSVLKKLFCRNTPTTNMNENNKLLTSDRNGEDIGNHYNSKKPRFIERCFRDKFSKIVIRLRFIILFCFISLFVIAGYYASQIQGLTEEENWFPKSHYMQRMIEWPGEFYGGPISELIDERFVWGIQQWVDRSHVKRWDTSDWGNVQFDNTFDLSTTESQLHIINVCDSIINNYGNELYDPTNNFDCFMYELRNYGIQSLNLTFPFVFDSENITNNKILFDEFVYDFTHFNEIGKVYLSDGKIGYDGSENKLIYIYISFLLDVKRYISSSEKDKVWRKWENIINEFNTIASSNELSIGVSNGYQIDSFAFAWSASEIGFITSAIQGISIAMPCALLCLIFSTQNWIISIYAIISICGIIGCELAVMVWNGWELGTAESIAVVIMIGFSVDYVVHLGNAYVECSKIYKYKNQRLIYSLFTMGISVLSGAITTFVSAFWLIFPVFMFYYKFAILVMTTCIFSLLHAFLFFISLLSICGPQNQSGYIFNCCINKNNNENNNNKYQTEISIKPLKHDI